MASHQHNPQFLFDALYCEEEHSDNGDLLQNCLIEGEGDSSSDHTLKHESFVEVLEHDLFWEDEELSSLLNKEQENELHNVFEENPSLAKARVEAVQWMLKVVGYYSFSALTAVLAVNYFDRFFHSFESHGEKPWMTQLAAVSCLSLAAKVEETEIPLLLDLQVEESKYVFESKTIQRMEILILSTLKWKMNPVTPFSFLDHIARRLGLTNHLCREFLRRCEFLLLSLVSDCRFMSYLPSALASATMLYVISSLKPCTGVEYKDELTNILGVNKNKVEECCRLIQEVATSVEFYANNKRKFGSLPESPKGVVDVCFSSDSSSDSVCSSPESLSKKTKSQSPKTATF